jgi:transcription elongation factor GreA
MQTLTKQGYTTFLTELENIRSDRPKALREMVQMRELGDLSENAGYRASRGKLSRMDNRIRFLEKTLHNVHVIEHKAKPSVVAVGTKVTIRDGVHVKTFFIVGSIETDPVIQKISIRSPLGKALMGRHEGDVVRVKTPAITKSVIILEITSV